MAGRRTTRCCSAVALILSCCAPIAAQPPTPRPHPTPKPAVVKVDKTPPSLMPVETVWALALNNQLTVPPAYDGTRAFYSIDGDRIAAYDLMSGAREWIVDARPQLQPAAGGGLLFFVEPDTLTALHAADGSIAWQIPFTGKLVVRPVWDNGWLILASEAGEVGAFRATDGTLVWRHDLKSPAHAAPALATDRVYVPTSDGRIVALRVETGEPVWERRLGGTPNEVLALAERVYVGGQDNLFYCLMAKDGTVDWRWRTGGDVIGVPFAYEGHVYFVALDNVLRALDLRSGNQQWMRPLSIRPAWGPVRAGSTIVVAGQAASLRAFNLKDGVTAGEVTGVAPPPPAPPPSPPVGIPGMPDPEPVVVPKAPVSFGTLASDAEVAAPPHVLDHPATRLPLLLLVFREIAKGASATLVMRNIEPTMSAVAALPNLIQIAPTTPASPLRP